MFCLLSSFPLPSLLFIYLFLKDFIYLFLERGEGRERERERNMDLLFLVHAPTGDRTCNPGLCPDWESNCDLLLSGRCPTNWATPVRAFPSLLTILTCLHLEHSKPFHSSKSVSNNRLLPPFLQGQTPKKRCSLHFPAFLPPFYSSPSFYFLSISLLKSFSASSSAVLVAKCHSSPRSLFHLISEQLLTALFFLEMVPIFVFLNILCLPFLKMFFPIFFAGVSPASPSVLVFLSSGFCPGLLFFSPYITLLHNLPCFHIFSYILLYPHLQLTYFSLAPDPYPEAGPLHLHVL